jgi:hypothetical protein
MLIIAITVCLSVVECMVSRAEATTGWKPCNLIMG